MPKHAIWGQQVRCPESFSLGIFFFLPVSVEVYNLVERDGREKLYAFTHKMLPK